jgi:phage regulator Rha-like protein
VDLVKDIAALHAESQKRHQEVLNMIEALSDASSDQASSVQVVDYFEGIRD